MASRLALCGLALSYALPAQAANPPVDLVIDIGAERHPISPLIYGVAWGDASDLDALNAPLNRHGGNPTSRYNWLENVDNRAADWFFESLPYDSATPGEQGDTFISTSRAGGAEPMLTIPMLDWVARLGPGRTRLCSFPKSTFDSQQLFDVWFPEAGNGKLPNGTLITGNDPNVANTPNSPTLQQGWLDHLKQTWGAAGSGGLRYYLLDNEASIWFSTHRDVHPLGPTMDEIRDKTVAYATRIRQTDPGATIVGPEEWGWSGYLYSGFDQQWAADHGYPPLNQYPDRSAHGGQDFVPWLLDELRDHQLQTGVKLLDVLALHYYPQAGEFWPGGTSTSTQLLRNRSTRALWDPSYLDEAWIGTEVQLIPRMKAWRDGHYPGLLLGVTEYNWGGEGHMNGATAQADILGIFGREGLDIATRWTTPDVDDPMPAVRPVFRAMQMYRNYDGAKSTFGDASVEVTGDDPDRLSAFAAQRSSDGALTVMAVTKSLSGSTPVTVDVGAFTAGGPAKVWQLAAGSIAALADLPLVNGVLTTSLPAQSVTLFVVPAAGQGCGAMTISPAALPDGKVGTAYAQPLSAGGGTAPLALAFEGSLPAGLGFAAGSLSGTPTAAGTYLLRFAVTDARGCRRQRAFRLVIAPAAGFAPVALAVDAGGNGVLESGETVGFVPSWRNLSGASGGLTGTLSSFTGPAGPAYTIPDSTADYGTIANGATAPAGGGYQVTLSGARPVAHWDASAGETPSVGPVKSWALHVGPTYNDVTPDVSAYRDIETLAHFVISAGCAAGRFCPDAPLTLRQLAVLALRAELGGAYGPAAAKGLFIDLPSANPYAPWVEELYVRGVFAGCGSWHSCPDNALRRAEMARYVLRVAEGPAYVPPAAAGTYTDVPSALAPWVEQAVSRGLAAPCAASRFCATAPVTRAQAATWLVRAFDLRLYAP
jgi:hypothetical protein